jgi:hypothetical protein
MKRSAFAGFIFSVLLGSAAVTACGATVSYSQLNQPPATLASREPGSVQVLTLAPSEKYVEVGRIQAHRDTFASNDDMIAKMREQAALRGCDALVITQESRPQASTADADAACIVYLPSAE